MYTGHTLTRRWLINLALLTLLALLALAVQLDVREAQREGRLTTLAPAAIAGISLHRAGEPTLRLARSDSGWQMLAPHAVPADAEAVARLLPVAQAQVVRTLPAAGLDLAELGLDPPALRLVLDGLELRFGGTEPVADLRYVQVGDMVHLIEDRFLPRLMTPSNELVSRRLLPPDFSPGLGDLDGAPLTAGELAPLAEVAAVQVASPRGGPDNASARRLHIGSADGGDGLHFQVSDGGRRWTRADTALSWVFATPPLAAVADAPAAWAPTAPLPPAPSLSPPRAMPSAPPAALPPAQPRAPGTGTAAPPPASAQASPLPVERLAPPAPGTEPAERRPTDAIPDLRERVRAARRDPSALPGTATDPFAPQDGSSPPTPPTGSLTPPAAGDPDLPLRTEKRSP